MAVFTFPFMVMNIGAALSNVDPMLEEAAKTLGRETLANVYAHSLPAELERDRRRLPDVLWLESRRVRAAAAPGVAEGAVGAFDPDVHEGLVQFNYGLAAALGIVLMVMAFAVTWVSLRFSRGALGA